MEIYKDKELGGDRRDETQKDMNDTGSQILRTRYANSKYKKAVEKDIEYHENL